MKAGTTWTVQIVKLIRDNGVESGKHVEEVFPFIDTMTLKEVEVLVRNAINVYKVCLFITITSGSGPPFPAWF